MEVRKPQRRYKVAQSSVGSKGGAIGCLDRFRVTVNTPRPFGGRRKLPFREIGDRVAVRVFMAATNSQREWRPLGLKNVIKFSVGAGPRNNSVVVGSHAALQFE